MLHNQFEFVSIECIKCTYAAFTPKYCIETMGKPTFLSFFKLETIVLEHRLCFLSMHGDKLLHLCTEKLRQHLH